MNLLNRSIVRRWIAAAMLAFLLAPSALRAELIINVGSHDLLPNLAGQTIQIFVSGGDAVQGLNLNAQIADGGVELGGGIDGPAISNVDLLTGTIFAFNHTTPVDPEGGFGTDYRQLEIRTVTTAQDTVLADGLLAILEIDTTSYFSGTFPLLLKATLNGSTDFAGVAATITDGSITIVPEGASAGLALVGGCILLIAHRRRRRFQARR